MSSENLEKIAQELRGNNAGISTRDIYFYLKAWPKVFTGIQYRLVFSSVSGEGLIDWLEARLGRSRKACVEFAREMLVRNYIRHITDSQTVVDSKLFFYTCQVHCFS